MKYKIQKVNPKDYPELIEVWEASVRATHHFLEEADIDFYKPLILNTYFDAVELRCIKNSKDLILGFSGVADHNLEMLFIHPDYRGKGIGKTLLEYSIEHQEVIKVDVNEDNKQAVGFYLKNGFAIVSRSELDPLGKPYPILHLKLEK